MSRQPDGWDLAKALCALGTVAGVLSLLSGEKRGGPLALISMVSGAVAGNLEPPICNSCDDRTTYNQDAQQFQCPKCDRMYLK